jgi:O-antigen/teichoic acid export membrane protein
LAPLGLATLLVSLNQSVLRLIIESRVGLRELGVFACVGYVVRLGSVATNVINQFQSPRLRAHVEARDGAGLRNVSWRGAITALAFGVVLLVVTTATGQVVFPAVFGSEIQPSMALLTGVTLAGCWLFAGMPLTMSLIALKGHKHQLGVLMATLGVTIIAGTVLTRRYGIEGAAAAWLIGESARTLGLAVAVMFLSRRLDSTRG